ncbi:MAG: ATP-binding protein [Acidobacteriaceae bacterium]
MDPLVHLCLPALLPSMLVCYKPDMRKWMSERLKRRQKSSEEAKAQPAAAPLQPAYFDSKSPQEKLPESPRETQTDFKLEPEDAEPAAVSSGRASASRPRQGAQDGATENQPSNVGTPGSAPPSQEEKKQSDEDGRPRRRRRGRGGRGRSQSGSARPVSGVGSAQSSPDQSVPVASLDNAGVAPSSATSVSKGVVVLAIGLPGSGKSSWFKRHKIAPLSSDLLRALLFDDPTEQRFQDLVFSNLRSMLKARLIARRPVNYVDATNLSPHERHGWIKLANDYGYEPQAVFFDVPLEVCIERNQRRERVVDEAVMRRMSSKLKPPTFEEGFKKITMVRVKSKDPE